MKKNSLIIAAAFFALVACKEKEPVVSPSSIVLSDVTVSESVSVPGTIEISAKVADKTVALSTLEISAALEDGSVVAQKSVRTAGNECSVKETVDVPFAAGMADGSNVIVTLEAINVDGASVKQVSKVKIARPQLPSTIYMIIGETAYEMTQSLSDANVYKTAEGDFESILTATFATAAELADADFIWGISKEENKAEVCSMSDASGVSISFPKYVVSAYTFNTLTFEVGVDGKELNISVNGTALVPQAGLLYASISFEKGKSVAITGIEDIENAYNRDFFAKDGNNFTFLRDSGTYDVYYSPKYNYIWIAKMDAVAPDCLWIVGHGFTQAPVFHEDFLYGGWGVAPITSVAYAVPVGGNKYQCSLYLNNQHEWGSFEFEIYSNLDWDKSKGFGGTSITGFTKGVKLSNAADGKYGLTSDSGFQPGYYTITFDNATGEINLDRISKWEDTGASGIVIKGTELEVDVASGFDYASISFVNGETVSFSGISAEELNRDFFEIEGGKAKFVGVSGTYKVQYYPGYKYTWLINGDMTFPDCIYILGNGMWSAPVYDTNASWTLDGWTRDAPVVVVAPKIGENTYKATMSMSTDNSGWRVLLEFYSDLWWGQDGVKPVAITGSAASRFYLNTEKGWFCGVDEKEDPFQPGNYCLVFTKVDGGMSIDVTRID